MKKLILIAALACAACGTAPEASNTVATTVKAKPIDPTATVTVAMPAEPATPWTGKAGAVIERNCIACHSPEMIANQPPLDAAKWQATIDKMRTLYKAEIPTTEDAALVAALIQVQAEQPGAR